MSTEIIPAPDAVKSESPAPVAVETDKSATQEHTPEAGKADGTETQATDEVKPKEDLSPAELARKERNRQRWQAMKSEREDALRRAAIAEAELQRYRKAQDVDYSQIQDPDEALAARTAAKVMEQFAGDHEAQIERARAEANGKLMDAWDAILDEARARMPDFDQVVTPQTPIHARAAPFIVESEKGAEIAYYLGKNHDVARDLFNDFDRNPARALIKLGRIEADISKSQKAVSSTPKPAPVLSGSSSPPGFDVKSSGVSDMQAMLRKVGVLR